MVGAANQTAENQAATVDTILEPYGGVKSFEAVASDNPASCLNMRDLICTKHPGIVSLNDQAHVANLLFKDVMVILYLAEAFAAGVYITNFVRGHQYLLAYYKEFKESFKAGWKQRDDVFTETATNFGKPAATRFGYGSNIKTC